MVEVWLVGVVSGQWVAGSKNKIITSESFARRQSPSTVLLLLQAQSTSQSAAAEVPVQALPFGGGAAYHCVRPLDCLLTT